MSSPTSTGLKGVHVFDNTSSETEREIVAASGIVYTRAKTGQKPAISNASECFRVYHVKTTTWKGASVRMKVPFDKVRGVIGTMGHPPVKAASLQARKPGVPTYIQGFRVLYNQSSTDNSATIAIIGRMVNGARASAAVARRCVYNWVIFGI